MKKILSVCCLLMGISAVSHAQKMFVPEDRAKQLQTLLKLSDPQTIKITGYYKTLIVQMDSVISVGGDSNALNPFMSATKGRIEAVLTPGQKKGYENFLQQQEIMNKKLQEDNSQNKEN
ncbi:hypothetical protein [Mucilaginibacter sp. L196]|uniref:hypothetical protein n=1 Tax=Mucilaginibacter sp. L196 TaxID=1641870 RepID=UPI001C204FAC|nr:hypothetical protein [Mucilaginibacter sp. L196]